MGKHFSDAELDGMHKWAAAGFSPIGIHEWLHKARARVRKGGPHQSTVRLALKGNTLKRSRVETRGRTCILSAANLCAVDRARKRAILKADGEYEVHCGDIIRAARIPGADRATVARNTTGVGVRAGLGGDDYGTTMGQLWDNYGTTMGQPMGQLVSLGFCTFSHISRFFKKENQKVFFFGEPRVLGLRNIGF